MTASRVGHTATVLPSGKVLITGGFGGGLYRASAELFDPAGDAGAGSFSATGPMATARTDHTATLLSSGTVLVVGGCNNCGSSGALASAELFDAAGNAGAGAFVPTGSLATARQAHTATLLASGKVLVAGGRSGATTHASAELFDPAGNAGAGSFAGTGDMVTARADHTASALPSGKVLVVGSGNFGMPSAEVFNPAGNAGAGAFAVTGPLGDRRSGHTASVLPSGKVLVVGGNGSIIAFLASAELFDAAGNGGLGTFAAAGSLAKGRAWHTASVLPSGRVLIAGGKQSTQASAEIFAFVPTGATCSGDGECLSTHCADGVCCDVACKGGSCDRCDLPSSRGTCSVAPLGDPGTSPPCGAGYTCDGVNAACTSCAADAACAPAFYCGIDGTCVPRRAQGEACNTQIDCKSPDCRVCTTGACVDGVCCESACAGQCQACDVLVGTCRPISGRPHGNRSPCEMGLRCSDATSSCEPAPAASPDGAPPPPTTSPSAEPTSDAGCSLVRANAREREWPMGLLAVMVSVAMVRRRRRADGSRRR